MCEARTREFLAENGLPEPDGVEYGHGCIRLFFDEPKVALVIDIDPPPEGANDADLEFGDAEPGDDDGYLEWKEQHGTSES